MGSGKGKTRRAQAKNIKHIPKFNKPEVRGEDVTILGPKPNDYTGLGYLNGEVLVLYPDGETGAVKLSAIQEAEPTEYPLPVKDVKRVSF